MESEMSFSNTVREYYRRIDDCDTDWVLDLFADDAVYARADAVYPDKQAISRFFCEERKIRGVHKLEKIVASCNENVVLATGRFVGVGANGDERVVSFADIWTFGEDSLVHQRQTFLAMNSEYVRA